MDRTGFEFGRPWVRPFKIAFCKPSPPFNNDRDDDEVALDDVYSAHYLSHRQMFSTDSDVTDDVVAPKITTSGRGKDAGGVAKQEQQATGLQVCMCWCGWVDWIQTACCIRW